MTRHRIVLSICILAALVAAALGNQVSQAGAASGAVPQSLASSNSLTDNFNNNRSDGWAHRDLAASPNGPSHWLASSGAFRQTSNMYTGSATDSAPTKLGSVAAIGANGWSDVDFTVRARSLDDDSFGVVFRYTDANNYYRFSMDRQRSFRRLIKVVHGVVTVLWTLHTGYVTNRGYAMRVLAVGRNVSIYVDGTLQKTVADASLRSGRPGLYTWGNPTVFDDFNLKYTASTYTIAVVPDIQNETEFAPAQLEAQMSWLAVNRGKLNLVQVMQEGDLVNRLSLQRQWATASRYIRDLDGKVPFTLNAGNHDMLDYGHDSRPYKDTAGPFNQFVGSFSSYHVDGRYTPGDYQNTYQLLSAAGQDLVVLNLVFGAPDPVLRWAGAVADRYPDRRVLLLTHDYLSQYNTLRGSDPSSEQYLPTTYNPAWNNGLDIWNKLVRTHRNIEFTFNGHDIGNTPGEIGAIGRLISTDDAGNPVYQTETNFQTTRNGGGYLRLFSFNATTHAVTVTTYSPYLHTSLTNGANTFTYKPY